MEIYTYKYTKYLYVIKYNKVNIKKKLEFSFIKQKTWKNKIIVGQFKTLALILTLQSII